MKCANHPAADAIGLCSDCGRALCPECQVGLERVACAACLSSHNNRVTMHFAKQLATSAGMFAIALILLGNLVLPWHEKGMLALMAAFLPFGWSALSRFFTPGGGYFHPAMRWMELLFHLGIAVMIGWLVGPWQIYKAIKDIRKGRAANASVRVGQETN